MQTHLLFFANICQLLVSHPAGSAPVDLLNLLGLAPLDASPLVTLPAHQRQQAKSLFFVSPGSVICIGFVRSTEAALFSSSQGKLDQDTKGHVGYDF